MCLAIPGKIVEILDKTAMVQYPGEQREVLLDPKIPVKVGDYVLIQMTMVIKQIPAEEAEASLAAWQQAGAWYNLPWANLLTTPLDLIGG